MKILDNGLIGYMGSEDLYEKSVDFDLTNKFFEGDTFKAKVKRIDE